MGEGVEVVDQGMQVVVGLRYYLRGGEDSYGKVFVKIQEEEELCF